MTATSKVYFRGVTLDARTEAAILTAEKTLGEKLIIIQGSFSSSVGASAGTHDGSSAVDCWSQDLPPKKVVRALRDVGFAAWHRTPDQGFTEHIHAILLSVPESGIWKTVAPLAQQQMVSYRNGCDGLGNLTYPDTQPYRPSPIPLFNYRAYQKQQRIADRIKSLSAQIAHLLRLRRKAKSKLHGTH